MNNEILIDTLINHKNKSIELSDLEKVVGNHLSYNEFYMFMTELVEIGLILPIKASQTNGKHEFLYNRYKIQKANINNEHRQRITNISLELRADINLDTYYDLPKHIFEEDLPYIKKINAYLNTFGYPSEKLYEPELAFRLVGNEKWFEQKKSKGSDVLKRIGLMNTFKLQDKIDPVAFGIDLMKLSRSNYNHLIIENKTTYLYLLEAIKESPFTTVIYGSGNMISSTIRRFKEQLPLVGEEKFYYFGDLDREGLRIWHTVQKVVGVEPALPFYRELMKKQWVEGKESQMEHSIPRVAFYEYFTKEEAYIMDKALEDTYIPQEALNKEELQRLMKEWTL